MMEYYSAIKEWNIDLSYIMGAPWKHFAESKKTVTKVNMIPFILNIQSRQIHKGKK